MRQKRVFIVPFVSRVFKMLHYISPLTIVSHFHRRWESSHLVVEIYVFIWFLSLLFLIWPVSLGQSLPVCMNWVIGVILVWRLLDISQAWFNIFMDTKVQVLSAVRSLVLVVINYFELSVIFGLLSFLLRFDNFNPPFATVTESLRHSIGIITTMGSRFDPASPIGGLLYYFEIAFGLAFIVVIISRVLSVFKEQS